MAFKVSEKVPLVSYAKVIVACFLVELAVLRFIHGLSEDSLLIEAVLHAVTLTATLTVGFMFWVYPEHRKDREIAQNETRFLQTLINAIPAPVFYKDENGIYIGCNDKFGEYLGKPSEEIIGKSVFDIAPADLARIYHDADMSLMLFGNDQVYETQVNHADGKEHDVLFHKAVYHRTSGEAAGIIGVMVDISERKALERRLQSLATIDALTNIPNRRELDHRLEQALLRNKRTGEQLALLFIDMDGFKDVNDIYGHEAGDEILRQIGARLTELLRKSDVAGRMGGDEFAVVLDTQVTPQSAMTVADKILEELAAPYTVQGNTFSNLSASIGIAVSPDDGQSLKTLLSKADKAMYQAKNDGKHRYALASDL
ncbi:diguanylate cyclase [Magnetovibrio sp. PR-2]|uniref:diguanylate cyclase domain-containing protein n=1 Tax=Magnetovibrio sp. PR-2 TaxID=3120356 RepID=UPI002FCE3BB9